jgi:hypothetical protein
MAPIKVCVACQRSLDISNYYLCTTTKDKLRPDCKDCVKDRSAKRQRVHRKMITETNKQREAESPRRYQAYRFKWLCKQVGITPEIYFEIEAQQRGACRICGRIPSGKTQSDSRLNMDHDHKTGKFRGLICHKCNVVLGLVGEDTNILRAMEQYLCQA